MAKIRLSVESEDTNTDLITTPEQIEEANDIKLADNIDELSCKIDTGLESITELLETKALLMDIANRKNDNRLISAMESRVVGTLREVGENVGLSTEKLALETSMIHAAASKIGSLLTWIKDGLIAIWKAIVKACSRIYQFVANFFKGSEKKEDDISDILNHLDKTRAEMERSKNAFDVHIETLRKQREIAERAANDLNRIIDKLPDIEKYKIARYSEVLKDLEDFKKADSIKPFQQIINEYNAISDEEERDSSLRSELKTRRKFDGRSLHELDKKHMDDIEKEKRYKDTRGLSKEEVRKEEERRREESAIEEEKEKIDRIRRYKRIEELEKYFEDKSNKMSGGESRRSKPFSGLDERLMQVNQPTDGHGHIKPTKYDKSLDTDIVDVENKKKGQPGYSHEDFSNAVFSSAPTNSYMFLGKRGEKRFLDANEARLDQLLSFAQEKLCVSTSHNYRNLIGKIYDLFHDLHFGNDLIPKDLKHYLDNSDSYDSKLASYREKVADKLEDIHSIQGKLINDIVGKDFMDSNIKVSRVTNSRYFNSFEFTFTGFDEKDLHNVNTLDPNTFKTLLDTINKNINIFKFTSSDKIVELLYDKSLDLTQKIEDTITKFSRTVDEKSLEGGSIDASVHKLSKYAHSLNDILVEAVKKLNTLINEIFKQHKATSTLLLGIVKAFRATVDYSLDTIKSVSHNQKALDSSLHK